MPIFVHVQGKPGVTPAEVEQEWGSAPESVSNGPKGLFVVMVDLFSPSGVPDARVTPHLPKVLEALKATFDTQEVATLAQWEYELISNDALINIALRKQGLVLTARDGTVAAAAWPATLTPPSIAETVARAANTLANARALNAPVRA